MSKNNELIIKKIDEGIKYITEQDRKLQPVIDYLTELCISKKEELSVDEAFNYLIQFMNTKTESLLLLSKMREILAFVEK